MNETSKPRYWFPAKAYGWGWGLPCTWQGWAVFGAYFLVLGVVAFVFLPHRHPIAFTVSVIAATIPLLVICALKGEPPQWRWGEPGSCDPEDAGKPEDPG